MRAMNNNCAILLLGGFALLAGCSGEPPPRTVQNFLDNPIILEAVMVRCAQNREETRYDAECVNARQAVSLIEAREERARRDALESQSERKRQALSRTQKAAAEARRRAAEAEKRREEAEYLAQFGELPPSVDGEAEGATAVNAPGAAIPDTLEPEDNRRGYDDSVPASDGGNAPVVDSEPESAPESDLDAVRDELRRRSDQSEN